jgi:putative toxin-antitoxin system antitoxin component (TIGR02293 family)
VRKGLAVGDQPKTSFVSIGRGPSQPALCHFNMWHNVWRGYLEMATNNLTLEQYIGVSPNSALGLAEIAEKGLPTDSIAYLKETGLMFSEISEIVIAPRTLKHRKARGEHLSVEETDRILRVARVISLADQVFGNHDKALAWLRQADERIHDRTPMSMLRTESGGRLVENLLWQIDEGVYS